MTDKEKCILELDWDSIFKEYNMRLKVTADMAHPNSILFMELVEQEINNAASKLIEDHTKDKWRSLRYAYQYGKNKVECIKEMRTIDKSISLKQAIEIIDTWDMGI